MELDFKFNPFLTNIEGTKPIIGGDSVQHWGTASQPADWSGLWSRGVGIGTWCLCQDREYGPGIRHRFGSGFQLTYKINVLLTKLGQPATQQVRRMGGMGGHRRSAGAWAYR